jgi:hypothetical protein
MLTFFDLSTTDVLQFINAIDADGGIYRIRWGDATIRWLQMALYANETEVHGFCDFKYKHDGIASGPSKCSTVRRRKKRRLDASKAKKQSCPCSNMVDLPLDSHLD